MPTKKYSTWIARVSLAALLTTVTLLPASTLRATDYFLTIAGGYKPEGNQASLEANVLFFQEVLETQHRGPRTVATFFADGYDETADLQVLVRQDDNDDDSVDMLATNFLSTFYSYGGSRNAVEYRNHRVPNLAGPLSPEIIEGSIKRQASRMQAGDRFFIYVTAHGGSAKGKNPYNTSISCWDNKSISASTFESWLDEVPGDVPVIMVMAQCYCGGFAHTIFDRSNKENDLSSHLRVGFFAQQHDLAAAGCRPDIDNDEEYSSFFWGALAGRTRNGVPIVGADANADGKISFAEAHSYAILASETIDIPIRSSEALLRTYSRIGNYDHRRDVGRNKSEESEADFAGFSLELKTRELAGMVGTLRSIAAQGSRDEIALIEGLCNQLEIGLDQPAHVVFERFEELRATARQGSSGRRGSSRGRRGRSGRRELWSEIAEAFPDLADRKTWRESDLLRPDNQADLFEELSKLPSFAAFQASQESRTEYSRDRMQNEFKQVKFQRLVNALEAILLAVNLPAVAESAVVERYEDMIAIEQSSLGDHDQATIARH